MIARAPRFEVVAADAGWFARFVGANGRKVWQTEMYGRRSGAVNAISAIATVFYGHVYETGTGMAVTCLSARDSWNKTSRSVAEVRFVDERSAS